MGKQRGCRRFRVVLEERDRVSTQVLDAMGYTGERFLVEEKWNHVGRGGTPQRRGACACGHPYTESAFGVDVFVCSGCGRQYTIGPVSKEEHDRFPEPVANVWMPRFYLIERTGDRGEGMVKKRYRPVVKEF